jgi:hypothetical protein
VRLDRTTLPDDGLSVPFIGNSLTAAYLAALVIIGALTGRSTEGLSLLRPVVEILPSEGARLERAADRANLEHGIP